MSKRDAVEVTWEVRTATSDGVGRAWGPFDTRKRALHTASLLEWKSFELVKVTREVELREQ